MPRSQIVRPSGTKLKALLAGKMLIQQRGYNGFSFQDIADELGLRKPSLYAHFKSKESLGVSVIDLYGLTFTEWTDTVETFNGGDKINGFFGIFFKFASGPGGVCPLSALAVDLHTLPKSMKRALKQVYSAQMAWLERTIQTGQSLRLFRADRPALALAEIVFSMGLGAQTVARVADDPEVIHRVGRQAVQFLTTGPGAVFESRRPGPLSKRKMDRR